ncbi:unnamed protein product [Arabis nemorensis]|uniref:Uncharacterized protein n=1 Tax=Arabis nemorensis TaxID=586526 RepID=A0A565B5Q0_9BRAS|nr:unnamed protein product [Arabis nemorensis]
MAVHLKDYDLLCTFDCRFLTKDETEASLRLATLNFSEPAIRWRNGITRFASSYCDLTRTVSVFKRDDGERRILRTMYANAPYHEEVCSRFDLRGGRLLCDRRGQIEGSAIAYIEGLEDKNVDQIIEIVVAGFDILSEPVLKNIYKIIASKVDQFGEEYLSESAERLGFVVRGDD